jgi:hypothetical protein
MLSDIFSLQNDIHWRRKSVHVRLNNCATGVSDENIRSGFKFSELKMSS